MNVFKGDPDDLVATGQADGDGGVPLADWRDLSPLTLLNLAYDVTPAPLVDAIISELSVLPVTSVPVVLRLKNMDVQTAY
jgi:translation initiation factor eIF-2B subunit delta